MRGSFSLLLVAWDLVQLQKDNIFEIYIFRGKYIRNDQLTWSKSRRHSPMIFTASFISSSEMTSGGAKRTLKKRKAKKDDQKLQQERKNKAKKDTNILTCVGFAKTPRLFNSKQNCHAVLPLTLFFSLMTTAFNNPLPRTSVTSGLLNARIDERKYSPSLKERSARRSSTRTERAVRATAQPSGLLQKQWR